MTMRGASADALATLRRELDGALRQDADAARVGDDLFTVSRLLGTEPALRRIATDVSVAPEAKSGLARDLFAGKVDAVSQAVVEKAFAQRWTATRDLGDALEHLSEVAVVRSAGSETERLSDELFALGQLVQGHPDLRDALSNPARSTEDKAGLLDTLLAGKALPATVTLAKQALAGTYRTVGVALATYQKVAAEVHGQGVATVHVARPLSEQDEERLRAALAQQYDRDVHLNVVVDPAVIGGIRVEIGDDVIDGTVSSRLDDARRRLAG
jgi:F-type H+-transporting ATPase subunit delta